MLILVCEDEPQYQERIQGMIDRWISARGHQGIKTLLFSSSEDLLKQWDKGLKADILFLDILFQNEMDGMQAAKQIRQLDESLLIVFVTNSEAYAKQGYAVRAFRYLSKPVGYEDIALCLDVAYKQFTLAHNEFFIIRETGGRFALRYEDILFLEAQSHYTFIWKRDAKEPQKIRSRFTDLIQKLPGELFVLCHRSYIANIIHVRSVRKGDLLLSSGQLLPVSRAQAALVNAAFDSYYQEGQASSYVDSV